MLKTQNLTLKTCKSIAEGRGISMAWKRIDFRGKKAFVHEGRIAERTTVPSGCNLYGLRHNETDWSQPCTVEPNVLCNFWGYLAVEGILTLKDDWINLTRGERELMSVPDENLLDEYCMGKRRPK